MLWQDKEPVLHDELGLGCQWIETKMDPGRQEVGIFHFQLGEKEVNNDNKVRTRMFTIESHN